MRAAGFDDEPLREAGGGDGFGNFARSDVDAAHHAAAAGRKAMFGGHRVQPPLQQRAATGDVLLEGVVAPEMAQRGRGGHEGVIIAAEGAVMFARGPLVEFRTEQGQRERQAHARQRLRHGDDVGREAHAFEAEEIAGPAYARLNVIDDHQRAMALGDVGDLAQPCGRRGVEPAFALNGFDQNGGRRVQAARRVGQAALQQFGRVDIGTMIAVIGFVADMVERHARAPALGGVAGAGQRAQGHAVEAVGEGDHQFAPGDLARQLDRRFHRVGAGRAGEHGAIVEAAGLEDHILQRGEEILLRIGVEVEAMGDAVIGDIVHQRGLEHRVVMAIVQRGAARQEVEIAAALIVVHPHVLRLVELARHRPGIAAHARFAAFIDGPVGNGDGGFGKKGRGHGSEVLLLVPHLRGQRADARLPFSGMGAGEMGIALETGGLFQRRAPLAGQPLKQRPRSAIIVGDGCRQVHDAGLLGPRQQRLDHAAGEPLAARGG